MNKFTRSDLTAAFYFVLNTHLAGKPLAEPLRLLALSIRAYKHHATMMTRFRKLKAVEAQADLTFIAELLSGYRHLDPLAMETLITYLRTAKINAEQLAALQAYLPRVEPSRDELELNNPFLCAVSPS